MTSRHDSPSFIGEFPFLAGGGAIGELIAAFNWTTTPLGIIAEWPAHVKTSVGLVLRSPVPIVMLWGADGTMIYNDAYAQFAGKRHPQILGAKVREAWPEVADFNDHVLKTILTGGTLTYRDQHLVLERSGEPEDVWLNLDYSPLTDDSGTPEGVIVIVVETTQKVRLERSAANERERLRQMFQQAPSFMAMLSGPQHVFELTNDAYVQLIGHRDVLGKPVREALPDVAGQGFFELLDGVYASGQPFFGRGLKVSLQRSPAAPLENRSVDFVYQPVLSDAGNVIGIFVEGTDITDRIAAEEALRASETLFRNFAEAMPNHVWTSTPDGLLDWFNTRVYEYCGASPGELDGQGWAKIVHPEDLSAAAIRWADALDSGKNYETAFRLRRADGVYRWHLARAVLLRDEGGLPTRWIGTNTDIENQRRADKQLVDSERRLRLSQNAAGIASVELDIATGDVFGSDSFWTLWGLTPRESISITELERIVLPEDRHIRSTPETRQSGTAVPNVEYRIRRPDTGELRWVSRQIEFIHDEAGKPVTMFGVMRDITREKEAQGRQEMLTHELEHRIKNILATVSAIASQTLRNTDIDTARNALNLRLRALADAHDILTKSHWTSASLVSVIRAAVAPLPTDRISIEGPDVAIGPKKALSLALAVNELGTNALKYGALSGVEGKVAIAWSKEIFSDTQERLIWRWTEMLGPPVVQPTRRGFGRFLLDRVLAADFDGQTHIDFLPEGLTCTLSAPWPNAL